MRSVSAYRCVTSRVIFFREISLCLLGVTPIDAASKKQLRKTAVPRGSLSLGVTYFLVAVVLGLWLVTLLVCSTGDRKQ